MLDPNHSRITGLLFVILFITVPAFAQLDFSGEWQPVRSEDNVGNHPFVGEFVSLPLSEAGRARGAAWTASIQTLKEWQCRPHGLGYITRGPSELRITKDVDPVTRQITAFHMEWLRSTQSSVWLDGRPHPPEHAAHTWGGFSTGEWVENDMLRITTTHLKEEYLRRNGLMYSDKTTITNYWRRVGDILTWVNIIYDPVYLTEPLIRSTEFEVDNRHLIPPYPCRVVDEVERAYGAVPSYLPGQNPDINDYAIRYEVPEEAARGGAEQMYPEYELKLKGITPPAR